MSSNVPIKYEVVIDAPDEPKILAYAENHLDEHVDTRIQLVAEFRDLIFERGECIPHRTDDDFLIKFLRARKFVVRHAHRLLVNYYAYRETFPELFDNICVNRWTYISNLNIVSVPPFYDTDGRRISVCRLALWDPDEISSEELLKYALLMLEIYLMDQKAYILGAIGIFDLEGITMKHMCQLTPTKIRQMSNILWSYPLRGHACHVVNQSSVFTAGFAVAKPFINFEMKSKLFIHGTDMTSLHQHIEPKYLPERYGGAQPDYDCAEWITYIKSNKRMLDQLALQGYDLKSQLENARNK